ncbi:hypothetical protein E1301_Tti003175 [Triplophysa tibetana]|uniref:Uncharacterized protein n=1 Tax=Triplophysa tibetana TaxID=1572043 RepID=A0A5A9PNG1_9TELE|nr:hypothetical protein E1301_Tti003175 [Triplophysa tibetana]
MLRLGLSLHFKHDTGDKRHFVRSVNSSTDPLSWDEHQIVLLMSKLRKNEEKTAGVSSVFSAHHTEWQLAFPAPLTARQSLYDATFTQHLMPPPEYLHWLLCDSAILDLRGVDCNIGFEPTWWQMDGLLLAPGS